MITSTTTGAIAAALAKAQADMGNAHKDRQNPAFRSTYATLAAVREAVTGPLSANGIAVVQAPSLDGEIVSVETRLLHTSGEWLACVAGAKPTKGDPQGIGSAISYLRRYGLMAMVGIAADDDDDGNAASGRSPEPARQPSPAPRQAPAAPPPPTVEKWNDAARKAFCADLATMSLSYENVAAFCESLGRPRPSVMTPEARSKLLAHLTSPTGRATYDAFITNKDKE